jgi:23S rRNA pseudouridine1911/1915/1917 synthase
MEADSSQISPVQVIVPENLDGLRLDQVAATLFADYSRARLQQWIRDGQLLVNGEVLKPRTRVLLGDSLQLTPQPQADAVHAWQQPESIPLSILHEDSALLVINKPAGLVVHPAAGNLQGTLLNGLLHHCPQLKQLPRAGIVHRLDKETSGLMVVAKTLPAHHALVSQLQARSVGREYLALVCGVLTAGGCVDLPLGRHPVQRKKQAVVASGKHAVTHYRVLERYRAHSLLQVNLETGRTHQIRVHMSYLRYPLIGDPLYGGRLQIPAGCSIELAEQLRGFHRQALHAHRLTLQHPLSGERCEWSVALPPDMQQLLVCLREDAGLLGLAQR